MKTTSNTLLLLAAFFVGLPALAEDKAAPSAEVTGVVRVVGSAYNSKVVISNEDGAKKGQTSFCRNELTKKIGRLSGMTILAKGSWVEKKRKNKTKKCFSLTKFTIEKASSGRKPLVGILSQMGSGYAIDTGNGTKHNLERVTKGLKELVGKKVIIDVKPLPGAKDKGWKVVSYSLYP